MPPERTVALGLSQRAAKILDTILEEQLAEFDWGEDNTILEQIRAEIKEQEK